MSVSKRFVSLVVHRGIEEPGIPLLHFRRYAFGAGHTWLLSIRVGRVRYYHVHSPPSDWAGVINVYLRIGAVRARHGSASGVAFASLFSADGVGRE